MVFSGALLALLITACTPPATPSPTPTPAPTNTDTPSPTATVTASFTPTASATATSTATQTPTKVPTRRPRTATPQPTSSGDATATPQDNQPTAEATTAVPLTNTPQGVNFAPSVPQVWELETNPYNKTSTDACGGDLAVDFYGLVAVTPSGDAIIWHRVDGIDYTLALTNLNHYAGAGPSSIPDYTLSISVTFTSATTLSVTHVLIWESNNDCKRTYQYHGKFSWNR
jgi:hypothetical protein